MPTACALNRRTIARLVIPLFAATTALLAAVGPSAHAYTIEAGCKWPSMPVRWLNGGSNSTYQSAGSSAVANWDATSTPLSFSRASSGPIYGISLRDSNFGTDSGKVGVTYVNCSGGTFSGEIASYWNTYYTNTSKYGAINAKIAVITHEIGHALGLNHNNTGGACSGVPIMYYSMDFYFTCGWYKPRPDDINGINYIY